MRVAGLLLTGGASRRLGTPKAELLLDGERLVERAARVLVAACGQAVEVGPGYGPLRAVREDPPGEGPLAALATGGIALQEGGHAGAFLALAVDLPFVEVPLLAWLAGRPGEVTVVPRVNGVAQTLCARYAPDAAGVAAQLVGAGERSLRALLSAIPVEYVDQDAWGDVAEARAFADVDTLEDATRAGVRRPG